jgi:hypothetical protein
MLRSAILLIAGIASASTQQATNSPAEAARVQDVYDVYSVLMANPPVIGGDSNKTFAFAALTKPAGLDEAPGPLLKLLGDCNAPPPGYEDRWLEVLSDFRSRSDAPVPLLHELKIAKPYIFLTEDEIKVFNSAHSSIGAPLVPNPQFGDAVSVIRLSNVYFNKDRSLAVVYISSECGMLCAEGRRKVFEKTATGWKEVAGGTRCVISA